MQATTIKLDGRLVERLRRLKPRDQTLTAFVRDVLEATVRRQKLRDAAESYAEFLRRHPKEASDMDAWASARLDESPRRRRRR